MRILVTGAAGFLGSELLRQAPDGVGTWHTTSVAGGIHLDVRDDDAVHRVLMKHGPELVIHTAYVQADADTIVRGSRNVALAAHRSGARLVHLSTDLVFDGEHGAPYDEDDEPRPVSEYGQAKLEAEQLVRQLHPDALIVRTSLLYGKPDGPQERLARNGTEFYEDEIRCPTRVDELATAILQLSDRSGVLHVAGPDAVSRLELARFLGAEHPVGVPTPPGRARNVALDSTRAGIPLTGMKSG